MTNQEINERIAKVLGWKRREHCKGYYRDDYEGYLFDLPNYTESLDLCHDFERALAGDNRSLYIDTLYIVCGAFGRGLGKDRFETEWTLFTATAHQRCEAFLRMKGQWDEN